MIKKLTLRNLTVFGDAEFDFSKGVNVIIGDNGTGKTHALKAAYSVMAVMTEPNDPEKDTQLPRRLAAKLSAVFKPDSLGRLARRQPGTNRCEIGAEFSNQSRLDFHFSTRSQTEVQLSRPAEKVELSSPVYLPARELLSIFPGFIALYEDRLVEFDETWRDTCRLLSLPALRGPRNREIGDMLKPLEDAMDARIDLVGERFYLIQGGQNKIEIPLVAEGLRKFATIARLIMTGAVSEKSTLFWDEPEANLNPRLIRVIAKVIAGMSAAGLQIILATHSMFLIRELALLKHNGSPDFDLCYFALSKGNNGVTVNPAGSLNKIDPLVALDEAADQARRFMKAGI